MIRSDNSTLRRSSCFSESVVACQHGARQGVLHGSEWRRRTVLWIKDEGAVDVQCHLTLILVCRQLLPRTLVELGGRGTAKENWPCNMSAAAAVATWYGGRTC